MRYRTRVAVQAPVAVRDSAGGVTLPRHVAFANPFLLTFRNTMFTELEVDIKTNDGLRVHAELVSVVRFRRGKAVNTRDYFLDPSVEEVIWGRREEPQAA